MISTVQNIVTFDLETTGLVATKAAILEIACCPFDRNMKDLKEYESGIMKVYDNREVSQRALDANGITREQIANGRDSKEVIKEFIKYLISMKVGRAKPVVVGHNIDKFDLPFLDDFFTFHGEDLSKYINFDFTVDTMWWARLKRGEQTNFKLGTCCEVEGVELINTHRAITDTRANAALVKKYINNLRSESTTEELIEERHRLTFEF
jgi:DNA polymerase III alpha subunit (gram-positive type)